MKKNNAMMIAVLLLTLAASALAQDEQQPPSAQPPAPAFGQESPAQTVSENPPISAVDQPGLDPHASAESFLLMGLHFSESVDSNVTDTLGGSATRSVTRGVGSLTLQKLWKNYDVALDYIGGAAYYNVKHVGFEQMQQLDVDNRINWKRGQLGIRDSFSYLPEGTFGFGAYGGGGAYDQGLGSLGEGMLGAGAFGGQSLFFGGGTLNSLGQTPRLMNLGLVDAVQNLTPKSSVTAAGGYGIVHFYGNPDIAGTTSFIGSNEVTGQLAYDRILTPRDQVALSYGYQGFDFSVVGAAFHSNVIQVMYGHRITGRMDFLIGAGPQLTHSRGLDPFCNIPIFTVPQCAINGGQINYQAVKSDRIGGSGRATLHYKFPKTDMTLSYERYNTSGSGFFLGAQSDVGRLTVTRPWGRVWEVFGDLGYARNSRLLPTPVGVGVAANHYNFGYVGLGFHRNLGRSLRAFASYQFDDLAFDSSFCTLSVGTVGPCNRTSQRHVGTVGLDWTPRPIRLD